MPSCSQDGNGAVNFSEFAQLHGQYGEQMVGRPWKHAMTKPLKGQPQKRSLCLNFSSVPLENNHCLTDGLQVLVRCC